MSSKVAILPTRLRWQILNLVGKVKISDAQTLYVVWAQMSFFVRRESYGLPLGPFTYIMPLYFLKLENMVHKYYRYFSIIATIR